MVGRCKTGRWLTFVGEATPRAARKLFQLDREHKVRRLVRVVVADQADIESEVFRLQERALLSCLVPSLFDKGLPNKTKEVQQS
jgi:hypothetical protein